MSIPTAAHFVCNDCGTPIEDCKNKVCDFCFTCEGLILSFPSFDLCQDCYKTIADEISREPIQLQQKQFKLAVQISRPSIPESTREAVYMRDNYECKFCGASTQLSVDHIIPFSKGGASNIDNYQTLCLPCNIRKGNKIM